MLGASLPHSTIRMAFISPFTSPGCSSLVGRQMAMGMTRTPESGWSSIRVLLAMQEDMVRKNRFSEEQIIGLLREAEAGRRVSDLSRGYGVSEATFCRRKSRHAGMDVRGFNRLRALEDENRRVKQLVADQQLDNQALKVTLGRERRSPRVDDAWYASSRTCWA